MTKVNINLTFKSTTKKDANRFEVLRIPSFSANLPLQIRSMLSLRDWQITMSYWHVTVPVSTALNRRSDTGRSLLVKGAWVVSMIWIIASGDWCTLRYWGYFTRIDEAWILTPFQVGCFLLLAKCEAHCLVGNIRHWWCNCTEKAGFFMWLKWLFLFFLCNY